MKFRCDRDDLVEALSTAGKAVTNRATLPVLNGLHLNLENNTLVITGSDLDLTITVTVDVGGEKAVFLLFQQNSVRCCSLC